MSEREQASERERAGARERAPAKERERERERESVCVYVRIGCNSHLLGGELFCLHKV